MLSRNPKPPTTRGGGVRAFGRKQLQDSSVGGTENSFLFEGMHSSVYVPLSEKFFKWNKTKTNIYIQKNPYIANETLGIAIRQILKNL